MFKNIASLVVWPRLGWRLAARMSGRKGHSGWIYSSASEEMMHAKPGLIAVSTLPSSTADTTLRLQTAMAKAHVVLASHP